ncbi:fused PTS fructose transporter subunit IIA/HPr protein [Vibrio sinaloensis]|uniref:fused PTS fructose transporter subunit IIA/HPr protein n=1 Tax=Photobacterium sp. (strain ATCC 43367) TaxID=379097 RepID=UPI00206AF91D|nr:fused PTS fructose transporter subunit IIA/HPr protein [Vibrio sinaloensis]UPQ89925.1 fused PTS fructose transporter subunit IIA/HPr protein [Vibrio sinaloensis]
MLKINQGDITLSQSADNKIEAIKNIAQSLTAKQLVQPGYVQGMLNREQQNSTYLGNGIAIPHGTTDTRDQVNQTGIAIHHFPQGVDWGDGQTAYLAIGIAAKSDEHLGILKQLTKVLGAEGVEQRIREAATEAQIIALLNGDVQFDIDFDPALIQLNFPASDMVQMAAVAGGLLKNTGCVDSGFVADLVTKEPTHLGQGLWLVGSEQHVQRTGLSFVSTANDCEYQRSKVRALIAFSACNNAHLDTLKRITELVYQQQQHTLFDASAEQLITLLTGRSASAVDPVAGDNTAVFRIKNAHGLHARPGAMLVAEAKKFESSIQVTNLDGDGKSVNAKSLMKVIALGVKHGHQLQFTAQGHDAADALESIGNAINAGLGES